jgi:hypothetical protein
MNSVRRQLSFRLEQNPAHNQTISEILIMASAASKTPTYGAPLPPRNVIIFLPVCGGGGGKKRRQLWRITCRCSGKRRLLMRPDTASNEKERGIAPVR